MKLDSNKQYLIGEISRITGTPVKTIRYYEEIGLVVPADKNKETKYRYYSVEQISLLNSIVYFKEAGFALKEIKELVKRDNFKQNESMIKEQIKKLDMKILRMMTAKNKIASTLNIAQNDSDLDDDIVLKEIPKAYIVYMRETGPCSPADFSIKYAKLLKLIHDNNYSLESHMMSIYYDDYKTFDYQNADIEVCAKVDCRSEVAGKVRQFGGFLAVVKRHYGAYDSMYKTYMEMLSWIKRNGYKFAGGAIEYYLLDIVNTLRDDEFVTEIIMPVIKVDLPVSG